VITQVAKRQSATSTTATLLDGFALDDPFLHLSRPDLACPKQRWFVSIDLQINPTMILHIPPAKASSLADPSATTNGSISFASLQLAVFVSRT
jgi:hypothetical protein